MSSHQILLQQLRTPIVQRTRSHKTAHAAKPNQQSLPKRDQEVLKPVINSNNNAIEDYPVADSVVPASAFTFAIDHTSLASRMPPRAPSTHSRNPTKRTVSRNGKPVGAKTRSASTGTSLATTQAAQSGNKRALSPPLIFDDSDIPYKRLKTDVGVGQSLLSEIETISNDGSLPPSSADVSMSTVSVSSEGMTISAESADERGKGSSGEEQAPFTTIAQPPIGEQTPHRPRTPEFISRTPINAAHIELSKTPKAPWLSSSKLPTFKFSPLKKSAVKPLMRTPMRPLAGLKFPTTAPNFLAPTDNQSSNTSGSMHLDVQLTDSMAASKLDTEMPDQNQASSSKTTVLPQPAPSARPVPVKPRNQNVSAAFALPVALSPTKTPARSFLAAKVGGTTPVKPKISKPSILKRVEKPSNPPAGPSNTNTDTYKSPLSSTLAALMNRTTVNPHAATQAQLSTLNQALEDLDAPRPPSSMSQQQPNSRPATSLGFGAKRGPKGDVRQTTIPKRAPPGRPGTSLGVATTSRGMNPPTSKASVGSSRPQPVPLQGTQSATSSEARRASSASLALSQSLPAPPPKSGPSTKAQPPVYTTASGRRVVSAAARAAPLGSSDSKDKSQEDIKMADASQPGTSSDGANNESSPSKRSAPLDILKDCVIFVDVRTEDGEDAGSLFVDMLRGLGAKILSRMGGSLTHIVYKSGLPSTLTKYRTIMDPKPAVVGIGWVVECVEKREKVGTERYLISLEEEAGSVLEGLKGSKSAGSAKSGGSSKAQGKGVQTTLQFKPVAKKDTS